MTKPIRTAIVDDHPLFREGVAKLLARTPGIEIVADGSTAADAVNIAQQLVPDILVLDLRLPDDGINAASTIAREHPGVRFESIDIEDQADLMGDVDVETFPTLLIAEGAEPRFFGPASGGVIDPGGRPQHDGDQNEDDQRGLEPDVLARSGHFGT